MNNEKFVVCVDYINLDGSAERIEEYNYDNENDALRMESKCKKYYYPQVETFRVYIKH